MNIRRTMLDNFCAFILTHGRPGNVSTHDSLRSQGYTGPIYLICDDGDESLPDYIQEFGAHAVLIFNKDEIAKRIDEGENFGRRNTVLHARIACFDFAEQLGFKYFIQLDDDYKRYCYKFNEKRQYGTWLINDLDRVIGAMLEYYKSTPILTFAMSQGGDHIGGYNASDKKSINTKRKAMNSFICSTDRPFQFVGTMNDDVNTYVSGSLRGEIFLTWLGVELLQAQTQLNSGGLSDMYEESGTYVKSFYSVMYAPSCVIVKNIVAGHKRIHHKVDWGRCAPKIIRETYRKERQA